MKSGLSSCNLIGFVPIVDVARAKAFYGSTLGLRLIEEELPYAVVYDANGIMLRLTVLQEHTAAQGTILGWQVSDASAAVTELTAAGVRFERYGFLKQDELGIWTTPTGARVAWFKDPEGNVLSVSEHLERKQ